MSNIRLTKNELRNQQHKAAQLSRYLPTLQLKKAMLQLEVFAVQSVIDETELEFDHLRNKALKFAGMLSQPGMKSFLDSLEIKEIFTSLENIAGVEISNLEKVEFYEIEYSLVATPFWWDSALIKARELVTFREKLFFLRKKKTLLEEELRAVSIRVNLFEKILIPRTMANIKKIKVFLGDQQLSAVATSKVAKQKITLKKRQEEERYA